MACSYRRLIHQYSSAMLDSLWPFLLWKCRSLALMHFSCILYVSYVLCIAACSTAGLQCLSDNCPSQNVRTASAVCETDKMFYFKLNFILEQRAFKAAAKPNICSVFYMLYFEQVFRRIVKHLQKKTLVWIWCQQLDELVPLSCLYANFETTASSHLA